MKENNSTKWFEGEIFNEEILKELELFVLYGILIEVKKNGQRAWKNNPDFDALSQEKQAEIFQKVGNAKISLAEVTSPLPD